MKGLCSKVDITYFSNLLKYEFGRREVSIDEKEWLTKIETSKYFNLRQNDIEKRVSKRKEDSTSKVFGVEERNS